MNNCQIIFQCDVTKDCDFKKGNSEDFEAECDYYNGFSFNCENKEAQLNKINSYVKEIQKFQDESKRLLDI